LPQAKAADAGLFLCAGVALSVLGALFRGVLLVVPGEACLDLGDVDVAAVQHHLTYEALVFVALGPFDDYRAAGDLVGEVLPRNSSEGLAELWGINAREPDLVLVFGGIEQGDGVAVVDRYHLTFEESGMNNCVKPKSKDQEKDCRNPESSE
jgi:hypothetical protein